MKTALADIKRLLANLICAGVVSRVDTTTGRCRVAIGQMETDWLPWLTPRAGRVRVWSAPSRGEQVTVLSPGGDLSGGFVLPAVFSDIHPAPTTAPDAVHLTFPDGAVMEYDPDTGALTARGIKTAHIQASTSATVTTPVVLVTASECITLDTPEVICTQHLRARTLSITEGGTMQGTLTHSGGSLTSNGVTLDNHRHGGVKGGGDLSGGAERMMFMGMHHHTGEALSDMAHLRQSVADILQTPTGSRVMRRDYGSTLFALIDQPQTPALRLQIMAAIYGALLRWEDRLTLTQLQLSSEASGKMTVDLVGQRTDTDAPLTLTLPLRG